MIGYIIIPENFRNAETRTHNMKLVKKSFNLNSFLNTKNTIKNDQTLLYKIFFICLLIYISTFFLLQLYPKQSYRCQT